MITSDSHSAAVRGPGAGEEAWVLRDLLQAGGVREIRKSRACRPSERAREFSPAAGLYRQDTH